MKVKVKQAIPSRFDGLDPQNELLPMLVGIELLFDVPARKAAALSKVPEGTISMLLRNKKLVGDLENWSIAPEVLKSVAAKVAQRRLNQPTPVLSLVSEFKSNLGLVLRESAPALEDRTFAFFRSLTKKYSADHILGSIPAFFASEKQKKEPSYKLEQFQKFISKSVVKVGTAKSKRVHKSKNSLPKVLSNIGSD